MIRRARVKMDILERCLGVTDAPEMPGTRPDIAGDLAAGDEVLARLAGLVSPAEPMRSQLTAIESEIDAEDLSKRRSKTETLRAEEGTWQKLSGKVWRKVLYKSPTGGNSIYLLRCLPGAIIPPHPHLSDEHVLVLEGEFKMRNEVVKAGDSQFSPRGTMHAMLRSPTGCLVLVHS